MIAKVTCALVLLFAITRGEDLDSVDLKAEQQEAINTVKNISNNSITNVNSVNIKLSETAKYFDDSMKKYENERNVLTESTLAELSQMTNRFVGEAIDKGKPPNTFKCLSNAYTETATKINNRQKEAMICSQVVLDRQLIEIINQSNELKLIQTATIGLYNGIIQGISNATTSSQITSEVHKAEARENNLNNLLRKYMETVSNLRINYNNGQMGCIRSAQASNNEALKACSNKMKNC